MTSHGPLADGGKGKFSLIQYLKGTLVNQQGYPTRHICYSFTLFKRRYTLYPFNFKKMSSDKLTIGIEPFMKKNNLAITQCNPLNHFEKTPLGKNKRKYELSDAWSGFKLNHEFSFV